MVTFAKSGNVVQTMKSRREQKVCTRKQSNNGRENISRSKTAFRSAKAALSTVTVVQERVLPKSTALIEGLKFYEIESQERNGGHEDKKVEKTKNGL